MVLFLGIKFHFWKFYSIFNKRQIDYCFSNVKNIFIQQLKND